MEFLSSTAHDCLATVGHVANRFYSWSAVLPLTEFFITTRPDTKLQVNQQLLVLTGTRQDT